MKSKRPAAWGPPSWPDTSFRPSTLPRRQLRDPQEIGAALAAAREKDPKAKFSELADRVLSSHA